MDNLFPFRSKVYLSPHDPAWECEETIHTPYEAPLLENLKKTKSSHKCSKEKRGEVYFTPLLIYTSLGVPYRKVVFLKENKGNFKLEGTLPRPVGHFALGL